MRAKVLMAPYRGAMQQQLSVRLGDRRLVDEADRDPGALPGSGFDIEIRLRVLAQTLHHEGAELAGHRPRCPGRKAHPIIRDDNSIFVSTLVQAFESDDAIAPPIERILEGVRQELVDEKTDRHGNIDRNGSVLDL